MVLYHITMSMSNIPREHYLGKLREARDKPFIKVITGIRRSGKSTLIEMFIDELEASGVPKERILHIDFDDLDTLYDLHERFGLGSETLTPRDLITIVKSSIPEYQGSYLFFDEIQNITGWEDAISTFYTKGADVYVTGSNSNMLSSELATKLSGRCIEIPVYTLTFSEYVRFRDESGLDRYELFEDFIRDGGFPAVALMKGPMPSQIHDILEGIYNTVYNKDVLARNRIRNVSMMDHLCRLLMKNIGDRTSVRSTANYLNSNAMKTQPATIDQYIDMLESALLFHRAKRLDSKTKEYLRTSDKFYTADLGIRNTLVPFTERDYDGVLENIVFMELKYRYGDVATLSVDGNEVDFVADPIHSPSYYQVSLSIVDETTRERELRSLKAIEDNYPKTVIVFDRPFTGDLNGIRVVNIIDWLLDHGD